MKRISLIISFFACCFAVLIACSKTKAVVNPSVVSLYNCASKEVKVEPYVCFDSLLADSRCPINVNCIWEGYALIQVSFHENNNTHHFKMSLNKPLAGGVKDTTINGYKVSFTDLQPYPVSGTIPSPSNIRATITITH